MNTLKHRNRSIAVLIRMQQYIHINPMLKNTSSGNFISRYLTAPSIEVTWGWPTVYLIYENHGLYFLWQRGTWSRSSRPHTGTGAREHDSWSHSYSELWTNNGIQKSPRSIAWTDDGGPCGRWFVTDYFLLNRL